MSLSPSPSASALFLFSLFLRCSLKPSLPQAGSGTCLMLTVAQRHKRGDCVSSAGADWLTTPSQWLEHVRGLWSVVPPTPVRRLFLWPAVVRYLVLDPHSGQLPLLLRSLQRNCLRIPWPSSQPETLFGALTARLGPCLLPTGSICGCINKWAGS
jgi:hypothetical protein